jgi:hypothetical protein
MTTTRPNPTLLLSLVLFATSLSAQTPATVGRGLTLSAALGPSAAARGVDASGMHYQGGIGYRARSNGFGVRVDMANHRSHDVPLYTCMVQDTEGCYQTIRRNVSATVASVTYNLPTRVVAGYDAALYLLAGVGGYRSNRVATRYPNCLPDDLCFQTRSTLEMRDRQVGASGGIGAEVRVQKVLLFTELRVHYAYRDTPHGQPSNDYFLVPLSIGIRF